MNVPTTFKDAGCDEAKFIGLLDELALKAFDDQCTPANPRFPLVSELKEVLKQSFYGEEEYNKRFAVKEEAPAAARPVPAAVQAAPVKAN
jgi:acetaldehyde dehydrogenase/alcohol dehydrogenase